MYDILIIGGGVAGLSAAIYAGRAKRKTVVIEKDYMGLGVIAASERVDNYPGLWGIGGYELAESFHKQAEQFGAEFYEGEISAIIQKSDSFVLQLKQANETLEGRSIIYAAGASYRRLAVSGAELVGVSYCATCDGAFYQNKEVAVVGGGDTALEDALYLSRIAKKVYLIHRRDTFRANQTLQNQVKSAENIELILNSAVTAIQGEKRVEGISFTNAQGTTTLPVNGVFVAIGSIPNSDLLKDIVKLDNYGYVIAGEDGVTSISGIFAAGDVRTKPLRQVVTAAADGANCVLSAEQYFQNR